MRTRFLVLGLLAACGNVGGDCQQEVNKTLTISTPADPSLQLKVEQCEVDVDACPALCSFAAQRANLSVTPETCDVHFNSSEVQLDIKYLDFTGGIGCPGPEPQPEPGSGVGFGGK